MRGVAELVDVCPTCGAHSVDACRDDQGNLLSVDHPDRPRALPDWLGVTEQR